LKYGSGPVLYKSGSMRAGPSLGHKEGDEPNKNKKKSLRKSQVGKLYRMANSASSNRLVVVRTPEGRPIKAGNIAGGKRQAHRRQDSM
jgi:hypothetical protein